MAGLSEIIIGIIILNVLFRIVRSLSGKPKVKTPSKPRPRAPAEAPTAAQPEEESFTSYRTYTEKEPATLDVSVEKFEQLMGEPKVVPPTPEVLGDEEKSWVEDFFETVEREFKKEEAPAYDKLPSYDERTQAAKQPEKPKLKKAVKPPPARKKPAKRPIKAKAREKQVATVMDMLGDKSSLRTAIVLSTILGPCRAKRRYRPGTRRTV